MLIKLAVTIALLISVAVLLVGIVWVFQERIAFQPPRGPWPSGEETQRVEYSASDGQRLFAYVIGNPRSAPVLLLAFHGNADLAVRQVPWAREINRRTSVAVMLAEYRGYAGLSGRPGYEESILDAQAAYRHAVHYLGAEPQTIAFFGHSMGSAVATELARLNTPSALILQSPFTSARDMATRMTGLASPPVLWRAISRLHFDAVSTVSTIDAPVFVAHGADDRLIPSEMGKRVFEAAGIRGEWLLVDGATHNDVSETGRDSYWSWIGRALGVAAGDADRSPGRQ